MEKVSSWFTSGGSYTGKKRTAHYRKENKKWQKREVSQVCSYMKIIKKWCVITVFITNYQQILCYGWYSEEITRCKFIPSIVFVFHKKPPLQFRRWWKKNVSQRKTFRQDFRGKFWTMSNDLPFLYCFHGSISTLWDFRAVCVFHWHVMNCESCPKVPSSLQATSINFPAYSNQQQKCQVNSC